MRVHTFIVVDIETNAVVRDDWYDYDGPISSCDPVTAMMGGSLALGAISGIQQGRAASKMARAAQTGADASAMIAMEQLELAREQWDYFKTNILPYDKARVEAETRLLPKREEMMAEGLDLQLELVEDVREGIKPQYERVTREAAADVDTQFDVQGGVARRNLERLGVDPTSGRYAGLERGVELGKAGTRAHTINRAREGERQRVEDVNYRRRLGVSGIQTNIPQAASPITPGGVSSTYGSAASGTAGAAGVNANLANIYGANAAGAVQGGINLAGQIYDWTRPRPETTSGVGGLTTRPSGLVNVPPVPNLMPERTYSHGGLVRGGYEDGGVVRGPGTGTSDSVPTDVASTDGNIYDAYLSDGEYVVPADVVMQKGTEFFDGLIDKYHGKRRSANG